MSDAHNQPKDLPRFLETMERAKNMRPQGREHAQAEELAREAQRSSMSVWTNSTLASTPYAEPAKINVKEMLEQVSFMQYEIPKERFVTYEPSDLGWMTYFGLAKKRPHYDTIVIPPGTLLNKTQCGSFRIVESEFLPAGQAIALRAPAFSDMADIKFW